MPKTLEELTSLAGVGRKTANVILGNIYDEPSIVVDTHVKRISKKLGLTKETEPENLSCRHNSPTELFQMKKNV